MPDSLTASLRAILNTDHFVPSLVAGAAVGRASPQGGGSLACTLVAAMLPAVLFVLFESRCQAA